jgi:multiple sugar transport system substrate-binding protein
VAKLLRWQKSLVDFYGHKNLVKWNAGAGDEFSASHAFETGKLAMMMDGEWRVAFIAAEHPELSTARRRCRSTARSRPLRLGYINGTIIGIPKSGKNKDASWALVKYLTTDSHALAQFSNGIRNVPSTRRPPQSKELKPGCELRDVHEDLRELEVADDADHLGGLRLPRHLRQLPREVAVGQGQRPQSGLQDVDKQIDAKLKQSRGRPAVIDTPAAGVESAAPAFRCSTAGTPGGRPPGVAAGSCSRS